MKTTERKDVEKNFSFKALFVPFTTLKAIHWIIFTGIIVYCNVLFNGFVWDDLTFIIANPAIHSFNILSLSGINPFNSGGYYRPIPAVYFSLLWNLFGNLSFFYPLFQIALHIANACLLFFFLKRYFKNSLSFVLVLIFLVHPIQVESVAYIGATQSELLFLPGLIALMLSRREKLSHRTLLEISFFLLLSLLTKETGFLFLIMILAYQFLFYKNRTVSFLPYLLGSVVTYFLIRLGYAHVFFVKNVSGPIGNLSLTERLLNIPAVIFYYLKTFFYPVQLVIDQRWVITAINFNEFYLPLIIDFFFFVLLVLGAVYLYTKKKKSVTLYCFFLIWFLIGLGLHLQIYPLDMTVADRWFYFPMVGLLGMFGTFFCEFLNSTVLSKKFFYVFAIIIVLLSLRTIVRNTNWYNTMTLCTHDSTIRTSFDLENNLGVAYANRGEYAQALQHFLTSRRLYPYTSSTFNIGLVYEHDGELKKAKVYYERALKESLANPGSEKDPTTIPVRIASVSVRIDTPKVASTFIRNELKHYPHSGVLWMYLAMAQYALHNQQEALIAAQKARVFFPSEQTNYVYHQILQRQSITSLSDVQSSSEQ